MVKSRCLRRKNSQNTKPHGYSEKRHEINSRDSMSSSDQKNNAQPVEIAVALAPTDLAAVPKLLEEMSAGLTKLNGDDHEFRHQFLLEARSLVQSLEIPRETMVKHTWAQSLMAQRGDQPQKVVDLATKLGVDTPLLSRLMRHIGAMGYVNEVGDDEYQSTNFTKALSIPFIGDGYLPMIDGGGCAALTILSFTRKHNWREPTDPDDTSFSYAYNEGTNFFERKWNIFLLPMMKWRPLAHLLSVPIYKNIRDDQLITDPSIPRHIYRSPPSPEVDAAWEALTPNEGMIVVSEDELREAGRSPNPSIVVKIPEDWGLGTDRYPAILEGIHQVHCFDLLRRGLMTNYEYYWASHYTFTPSLFFEAHLNHCLDPLLQDLMCSADQHFGIFTWVEGHETMEPNFRVHRTCRNYGALLQWFEGNTMPEWKTKVADIKKKPEYEERQEFPGWPEYASRKILAYDEGIGQYLATLDGELPPPCTRALE
ncbi:hypothetical protein HD806DRAFT_540712 [Xylariaceae sp. AK1471]|nr:hypothetical protein HD806DRAFT_540712 [Xylariaceae sp. AK1471]